MTTSMPRVVTREMMVGKRQRGVSGWRLLFEALSLWELALAVWGCVKTSPWIVLNGLCCLAFAAVAAIIRPGCHCSICGNRVLKTSTVCPTCRARLE